MGYDLAERLDVRAPEFISGEVEVRDILRPLKHLDQPLAEVLGQVVVEEAQFRHLRVLR